MLEGNKLFVFFRSRWKDIKTAARRRRAETPTARKEEGKKGKWPQNVTVVERYGVSFFSFEGKLGVLFYLRCFFISWSWMENLVEVLKLFCASVAFVFPASFHDLIAHPVHIIITFNHSTSWSDILCQDFLYIWYLCAVSELVINLVIQKEKESEENVEEDADVAAMMGFGGFRSSKKWNKPAVCLKLFTSYRIGLLLTNMYSMQLIIVSLA